VNVSITAARLLLTFQRKTRRSFR